MRRPTKTLLLISLFWMLCFHTAAAYGAEQSPEGLVREFYAWYMKEQEKERREPIEYNDIMYNYVYPCTVNKLRVDHEQGARDADYFLFGQDFIYEVSAKNYTVHPAVPVTDTLSLVPVGTGTPFLMVFVRKTKEGWRIIKVDDKYFDYY